MPPKALRGEGCWEVGSLKGGWRDGKWVELTCACFRQGPAWTPGQNGDKEKSKTLGLLALGQGDDCAFVQAGKEGKAKAGLVGWGGWGRTGGVRWVGWAGRAWHDFMIYGPRNRSGQPLPPPSFEALPLDHDITLPSFLWEGPGVHPW